MVLKLTIPFALRQHERLWKSSPPSLSNSWNLILMDSAGAIDGSSTFYDWMKWECKQEGYERFWTNNLDNIQSVYNAAKYSVEFQTPLSMAINNLSLSDWDYDSVGVINTSITQSSAGRVPSLLGNISTDENGTYFECSHFSNNWFNATTGVPNQTQWFVEQGPGTALDSNFQAGDTYSVNSTYTDLRSSLKIYLTSPSITTPSTNNLLIPPSVNGNSGIIALYKDDYGASNLLAGVDLPLPFKGAYGFSATANYAPAD